MTAARFRLVYALVAVVVFSAAILPSFAGPAATAQAGLFADAARPPASVADGLIGQTIVRNRYVDVNFAQLDAAVRAPAGPAGALQMNLFPFVSDLFPDVSITAVRQRVDATRSGQGAIWLGKAQGVADSAITLVSEGGLLAGNIQVGNRFFQIRYAGDGVHAIQEVNSSLYPDEQPPLRLAAPAAAAVAPPRTATPVPSSAKPNSQPSTTASGAVASSNALADNGSTIDVLVVYSQGAFSAAGGTPTAINNLITLMESETNQGYAQSNVNQRLRVVQRQQVNSAEGSTNQTYLDRMINPSDGFMDEVPGLRNSSGADLVFLLQSSVADPCGQAAMILNPVNTAQAPNAYAVGEEDCSTGAGGWTFGHELGHLMGARHDWGSDPTNNQPFTYNHGYIQPGPGRSCDLMAVRGACSNAGNNRANYWSNPNIIVSGLPIGIPEGQPNAAENWKTLNNTASTVANFRTCVVAPCDVPPTVVATATVAPAPPNNNFAAATAVGALPANFTANTTNATLETGEQVPGCGSGFGKSVWYVFSPAATMQVTVSTAGSNFDTILGVWTGGALGGLTAVACNDDFTGTTSQVTFIATAGTTYRIQVGGFGGAGGSLAVAFSGIAPTSTPTATPIPTPVVNCNPRPPVTTSVQPIGNNAIRVTLSAGANGWINQVQIGNATNARIDIAGQTGITGNQTITLPPATTTLTFTVFHSPVGQSTTVPLTVVDTCGSWPTLVGGGPSAF
jgi:hypothetical protein